MAVDPATITIPEPPRHTPVVAEADVLVVGGGPAGFVAATAAGRLGARVTLVERYGCLGGLASDGLVLAMIGLAAKCGPGDRQERVVGGLTWETLERLRCMGGLAEEGPLDIHVDSELLKVAADALCLEAGVALRFHCWAVGAIVQDGAVRGVITESKEGRAAILCKVCVDATGDGDISALAGVPYEFNTKRIGLNLKLGGVDRARFVAFQKEQPAVWAALRSELHARKLAALSPNITPYSADGVYWSSLLGLVRRDSDVQPSTWGDNHTAFDGTLSALSVADLSYAETELRRRAVQSIAFHRQRVPGFEGVQLLHLASQLGVRESRRIMGEHVVTKDEALGDATYPDTIGMAGLGFASNVRYRIPYRSLVARGVEALLVAGRCISTDHWTQEAIRLIPACMVTGQAAGTAAALVVRAGIQPRALDADSLRRQLADDGVIL